MSPAWAVAAFVLGAILGSFVTVVAHRAPRGESFVTGRSKCPGCGAQIGARDNIPILGWLLLRGRCRNCGEAISPVYPLTELGLGLLFLGTYLALGDDDTGELVLGLVFCTVLATITLTDLELRLIPNAIVLAGAIAAVAIVAIDDPSSLDERAIAAAIAGGVLLFVAFAYPQGMGMGDVKLVAMMGLYLGRAVAPAVLIGFLVGAVVGVGLIARRGSEARKQAVPFGPFLALGGIVGVLAGNELVNLYLGTF
jgi:leader peptidase (prepilin peptidase)/N-methyltransferase